ncbi:unnamed protein product [Durusdinium trenchii]|uniref:ShKT domain-containing protein n=1 Tax=Durusdinium trenchii TaxID=1381693 RepID=A0ABP0R076_9DINO
MSLLHIMSRCRVPCLVVLWLCHGTELRVEAVSQHGATQRVAIAATGHLEDAASTAKATEAVMRREEARSTECFRDDDWTSNGCPVYDQTKCSSYSEKECSTSCEEHKVCLRLYMSPLSYTCCDDGDIHHLFHRVPPPPPPRTEEAPAPAPAAETNQPSDDPVNMVLPFSGEETDAQQGDALAQLAG